MFESVKSEMTVRIVNIEQVYQNISDDNALQLNKFIKGIIWVYLYGIWEYVVTETIAQVLLAINDSNTNLDDLKSSLYCLVMHPEIEAANSVGRDCFLSSKIPGYRHIGFPENATGNSRLSPSGFLPWIT